MADLKLLEEAARRGILPPEKQALYDEAVKRGLIGKPQQAQRTGAADDVGAMQAGAIATGKGFYNVGRALGLADPADEIETQAFRELEEKHPKSTMIGQAVGEAAPFLPAGVGVGAIRSLAPRVAAGVGLGTAEGGIISKGRGEDVFTGAILGGAIGGVGEVLLPGVIRASDSLFRKVTGKAPRGALVAANGTVTPQFQAVLDDLGISIDDITVEEVKRLKNAGALSQEQLGRLAQFNAEGVSPTLGDITQDYGQMAAEARLAESSADELATPFRTARLAQSEKLRGNLDELGKVGSPEEAGASVKVALSKREEGLRRLKNRYYKAAAEKADEAGDIIIEPDAIVAALPDKATMRRVARLEGSQSKALDELLIEFGLDESEEAVKAFKGEITPLSVRNVEDFRAAINQIERADKTGAMSNLTGPLRRALDTELDQIVEASDGVVSPVVEYLKKARSTVRTAKTEFSPQSIVGRLSDVKKDGITPVVEASKVYRELMGSGKAPELISRTVESLSKNPQGRKAISDMQASAVLDLVNSAFSTQSRTINGTVVFNPNAYNRKLKELMDGGKLSTLFRGNTQILGRLERIGKIASAMQPPSGAVPKGSANDIRDVLNKLGVMSVFAKIPGAGIFAEGLTSLSKRNTTRGAVKKALNPRVDRVATILEQQFPQLANALAIPAALPVSEEE